MTSAKEQFEKELDELAWEFADNNSDRNDCDSCTNSRSYAELGFEAGYTAALSSSVVRELTEALEAINISASATQVRSWTEKRQYIKNIAKKALSNLAEVRGEK